MASIRVDTSDLSALKGATARKVLARCANEVKHWKIPSNFTPEQTAAVAAVLRDINHCFNGYAALVASTSPAPNEMLEKMVESAGKF